MELVSSKKLEAVAKFLVDDEVDGIAPCSYLNNYLKRDRVNVPCDDGDCKDYCPFYSTANFIKWIKKPEGKIQVEDLEKPKQEDFIEWDRFGDGHVNDFRYAKALEQYCNDLENVLADTEYDLESSECENRELQDVLEKIRGVLNGKY